MGLSMIIDDEEIMSLVNKDELLKLANKVISAKVTEIVKDWVFYNLNDEIEKKLANCGQALRFKVNSKLYDIADELAGIIYNDIDKLIAADNVQDKLAKELLDELHN